MFRWIKRLVMLVGTLVVLAVVFFGFMYFKSGRILATKYTVPTETVAVVSDSASLARGEHLARSIAKCAECHGEDFSGSRFIDDPALGLIIAPNLTKGAGGQGNSLTDSQMESAIRHGVRPDGTSLLVMPSEDYQYMSDADIAAVIAYVRSKPPIDKSYPATALKPVGRALMGAGQLPINVAAVVDQNRKHPATIVMDTSLEYGHYLTDVGGCTGCHGPTLSGGKIPGVPPEVPPAANITPTGIKHYTDAQVATIMRTGKRPDGSAINDFMPWRRIALMTDDEINTTIKYLRTVAPKDFGGR